MSALTIERLWVTCIRVFIALIAPLLALAITGCDDGSMDGEKVSYGPQFSDKEVINAVYGYLIQGSVPSATKAGAFVHFATTEDVAGGTLNVLVADTGQTVISRIEDDKTVTFNIVEKTVQYHQDSANPEKLSRNFDLAFDKPAAAVTASRSAAGQAALSFAPPSPEVFAARIRAYAATRPTAGAPAGAASGAADAPSPTPLPSEPPAEPGAATFHKLRFWNDRGPAPAAVRDQPNCGGIPGCTIQYRHVVFDIVTHDDGDNLIHMELTASPDVPQTIGLDMNPIFPYVPGLMRTCYTRMITVGTEGNSKTLLADCNDVVNFTFDINALVVTSAAAPTSVPTDSSASVPAETRTSDVP